MIRIQIQDFSVDAVISEMNLDNAGAVVTFTGRVRGSSRDGKEVQYVEWDVYQSMARRVFGEIREEALERHHLTDAAIVHRYGRRGPGKISGFCWWQRQHIVRKPSEPVKV